jgi:hypothetical protein
VKIIKTFLYDGRPYREWGLGNDGHLYSRFIGSGIHKLKFPEEWQEYYEESPFGVPFGEMKRIVKEFGHLLVWM